MRKVGTTEYAEILFELTDGKSDAEVQKALQVFTSYLAKHKAFSAFKDIKIAYQRLVDSKEGRVRAILSTTEKLDTTTQTEIEHAIKKSFNAQSVVLEERMDAGLIGGWKARTEDYLIDASLKGRLTKLERILTK